MQTVEELQNDVETLKRLVGMLTWQLVETKRAMVEMERTVICEGEALLDRIREADSQVVWE